MALNYIKVGDVDGVLEGYNNDDLFTLVSIINTASGGGVNGSFIIAKSNTHWAKDQNGNNITTRDVKSFAKDGYAIARGDIDSTGATNGTYPTSSNWINNDDLFTLVSLINKYGESKRELNSTTALGQDSIKFGQATDEWTNTFPHPTRPISVIQVTDENKIKLQFRRSLYGDSNYISSFNNSVFKVVNSDGSELSNNNIVSIEFANESETNDTVILTLNSNLVNGTYKIDFIPTRDGDLLGNSLVFDKILYHDNGEVAAGYFIYGFTLPEAGINYTAPSTAPDTFTISSNKLNFTAGEDITITVAWDSTNYAPNSMVVMKGDVEDTGWTDNFVANQHLANDNSAVTFTKSLGADDDGAYKVKATNAGGDTESNNQLVINVTAAAKIDQTISFGSLDASYTYGVTGVGVSVSGASTTVEYSLINQSPSGVASIDTGGTITINKAGSFTVKAKALETQTHNGVEITRSITVNKKTVTIQFADGNQNRNVGDSTFTKVATIESTTPVATYDYSRTVGTDYIATVSIDGLVTIVGEGTATISASIKSNDPYYTQSGVNATYDVNVSAASTFDIVLQEGGVDGDVIFGLAENNSWYSIDDGAALIIKTNDVDNQGGMSNFALLWSTDGGTYTTMLSQSTHMFNFASFTNSVSGTYKIQRTSSFSGDIFTTDPITIIVRQAPVITGGAVGGVYTLGEFEGWSDLQLELTVQGDDEVSWSIPGINYYFEISYDGNGNEKWWLVPQAMALYDSMFDEVPELSVIIRAAYNDNAELYTDQQLTLSTYANTYGDGGGGGEITTTGTCWYSWNGTGSYLDSTAVIRVGDHMTHNTTLKIDGGDYVEYENNYKLKWYLKDEDEPLVDDDGIRNIDDWELLLDSSNPPSGWGYNSLLIIPESALGKYLTIVVSWEDTDFKTHEREMETFTDDYGWLVGGPMQVSAPNVTWNVGTLNLWYSNPSTTSHEVDGSGQNVFRGLVNGEVEKISDTVIGIQYFSNVHTDNNANLLNLGVYKANYSNNTPGGISFHNWSVVDGSGGGDVSYEYNWTTALEGNSQHWVTKYQWQKKPSGGEWSDIDSGGAGSTLNITDPFNIGDKIRVKISVFFNYLWNGLSSGGSSIKYPLNWTNSYGEALSEEITIVEAPVALDIVLSKSTMTLGENAGSDTFIIGLAGVLNFAAVGDVKFNISAPTLSESDVSIDPPLVTFTATDYSAKTITVTAVDNSDYVSSNKTFNLTISSDTLNHTDWLNLEKTIGVVIEEDEDNGIPVPELGTYGDIKLNGDIMGDKRITASKDVVGIIWQQSTGGDLDPTGNTYYVQDYKKTYILYKTGYKVANNITSELGVLQNYNDGGAVLLSSPTIDKFIEFGVVDNSGTTNIHEITVKLTSLATTTTIFYLSHIKYLAFNVNNMPGKDDTVVQKYSQYGSGFHLAEEGRLFYASSAVFSDIPKIKTFKVDKITSTSINSDYVYHISTIIGSPDQLDDAWSAPLPVNPGDPDVQKNPWPNTPKGRTNYLAHTRTIPLKTEGVTVATWTGTLTLTS